MYMCKKISPAPFGMLRVCSLTLKVVYASYMYVQYMVECVFVCSQAFRCHQMKLFACLVCPPICMLGVVPFFLTSHPPCAHICARIKGVSCVVLKINELFKILVQLPYGIIYLISYLFICLYLFRHFPPS